MGEEASADSPYPPRQDGYVDCLTSHQKAALVELCNELPAALEGISAEHLTLWSISLADLVSASQETKEVDGPVKPDHPAAHQRLSGTNHEPSRAQKVVLLKFLRARQFNVQAAVTMLANCLKWRRDFDASGLALETFPPQLAAAGQLSGRDRAGNPVTYNYYGGKDVDLASVFSSPGGVATFVRWRVKLMEQAVGLLDFDFGIEHVTQVHDYSGASMFRMDSHVKTASRQIIRLFQDNYPEMLSTKLFLNVPRVMEFVFGVFSTFSDAATRAKFVMASPARARSVLLHYIDPVQVPARFGGFLETCSVPPNRGRPTAFVFSSKQVNLKPGDSHVTSKLVGPDSEVVWCFCTSGLEINVEVGFRPRDNGEAAAAAARQPDIMTGAAHPNMRARDAQHITEAHNMVLNKDSGSGRLVLGCPGEVTMTLDNSRHSGGFGLGLGLGIGLSGGGQPLTVHYALVVSESCGTSSLPPRFSLGSNSVGNGSGADGASGRLYGDIVPGPGAISLHPMDWRNRVFSYKSFGCSSLTSNDVGDVTPADLGPDSPTCRGAGNGISGGGSGLALLSGAPSNRSGGAGGGTSSSAGSGQGQGQQPHPHPHGLAPAGVAAVAAAIASGRFEPVPEVDESGTMSPGRTTVNEESVDREASDV